MLGLLKKLFCGSAGKNKNLPEPETTETKKCLNCLRRVKIEKEKCSFCGKDNFQF